MPCCLPCSEFLLNLYKIYKNKGHHIRCPFCYILMNGSNTSNSKKVKFKGSSSSIVK
jgi:hypothetical protein